MASFNMSAAWGEAIRMTKAHGLILSGFILLLVIASVLTIGLMFANVLTSLLPGGAPLNPGDISTMMAQSAGLLIVGYGLFYVIVMAINMACFRYAATDGNAGFLNALKYGAVAAVPVLFAFIIMGIVFLLLFGILGLVFGAVGFAGFGGGNELGAGGVAAIILLILLYPAMLGFFLFLLARIGLAGPIMGARESYNPFTAIAAAWALTSGNTWRLMAYYFVSYAGMTFAIGAVVGVFSLITALISSASVSAILGLIIIPFYLLFFILNVTIPVGAYRTLQGGGPAAEEIASIFD